jgi:nanoRNase/pAp phosphatase (c-di-AMP/oligoRNAs hydrolase)
MQITNNKTTSKTTVLGDADRRKNLSNAVMIEETNRKKFVRFLEENREKRLIITTHKTADADGICAAFVLSRLLPNAVIAFQDDPYVEAYDIIRRLGIEVKFLKDLDVSRFDGLVITDTSSSWRVPFAKDVKPVLLIIDHHERNVKDLSASTEIIEQRSSTCEIVWSLLPSELIKEDVAFALAVGITTDARDYGKYDETEALVNFLIARSGRTKVEVEECVNPKLSDNFEQAIQAAIMKARKCYYNGYVIKLASIDIPIQPRLADKLLETGCDIAVATYKVNGMECASSLRIMDCVNLDGSVIMKQLGEQFGGNGGGHQHKAGATTYATAEETLNAAFEIIKKALDGAV